MSLALLPPLFQGFSASAGRAAVVANAGIGDSLDLVVLGVYYGKGKRTSWYGASLLAAYNPTTQNYETVCNIGTGFSERILEELHTTLEEHVIDKPKPFYSHSSVKNDQPDVWLS